MKPLKDILDLRLSQAWWTKKFEQERVKAVANKILEKASLGKAYFYDFKKKTLFVRCPDTLLASQLRLSSFEILQEINQKLGKPQVKNIRVIIKKKKNNNH